MTYAIETDQLRKAFGENVAVRGLTLQVAHGEVFGFLGPNGAGKTTSLKMFLGLVAPTSGSAMLLGAPLGDRAVRGEIGFLPEHFRFHDWLTAQEFLTLHGRLYRMDASRLRGRLAELLELVGLTPFRDKRLRTFSKGMLQRIGLAQALLNNPKLVFLDEPTSGLDPVGRRLVRDIIHDLRKPGHDRVPELPSVERGRNHLRSCGVHQARRGAAGQRPQGAGHGRHRRHDPRPRDDAGNADQG